MTIVERIIASADRLTATERRIAEIVADEPHTVAFGTVASLAKRAGTSGPSVVRLAVKLGFEGFVAMQAEIRQELTDQLGRARDRIRQRPPVNLLEEVARQEQDNVARTFAQVDPDAFDRAVASLADLRRHIWVVAGEASLPISSCLCLQLGQLRENVQLLGGSEVSVKRELATARASDVVVVMDVHRYERWLVEAVAWVAAKRQPSVIALTDSPLSPLVAQATEMFIVAAGGVGPFDSMTANLALVNALVVGVAARLAETATARLDAIESAWTADGSLVAEQWRETGWSEGQRVV